MGERHERPPPLVERPAAQVRHPELGDHEVDLSPRAADGTVVPGAPPEPPAGAPPPGVDAGTGEGTGSTPAAQA